MKTCTVLRANLSRHHLLGWQLLLWLPLEAALGRSLFEILADMQGRRSEISSILAIRCRLFA